MNKIVFYLLNEKGYYVLKNYLQDFDSNSIEYVVLAKDNAIKNDFYNEIKEICISYSIKWFDQKDIIPNFLDYKFAIGWRWIIKDTTNLIVLHDSILPKYRGFAPLVNMLINGENELGVTALFASDDYDKGKIIVQEKVKVTYPMKIQDAINIISPLYYKLISMISKTILSGKELSANVQSENNATYSLWRDEKDYYIDWNKNSQKIIRMIDATGYPYAGAHTTLNGEVIILDNAVDFDDLKIENRDEGKIIFFDEGYPVVVCGEGLIKITEARYLDGKSIFPFKKFRSRFGG
jgi:methionyl-tRNA formyltransferase